MVRMFWYLFTLFNCQAEAVGGLEEWGGLTPLWLNELEKPLGDVDALAPVE